MTLTDLTLDELNEQSKGSLMGALGIRYTLATPDRVEAVMPVCANTRQPFGLLHGGATLALAETVAGLGSMLACDGKPGATVGMQVSGSHLGSARDGEEVRAIATPIHLGRRTHVWNVDVENATTGAPISSIRVTNYVVRPA